MDKELSQKLTDFENEYNCRVVYVTKYGSKLYGTDNENSDTDYKGIFIPNKNDVLLKKDLEHWTSNTNNSKEKNSASDIDLQLFSIHKFFELVRKGETGALDLLFSMNSNSVVFADRPFVESILANKDRFLNKNLHSFVGYAVGQAKKYGIKGSRYKELARFTKKLHVLVEKLEPTAKLSTIFSEIGLMTSGMKYIDFTEARGPKTGKGDNYITYVNVLGKMFSGDVTIVYFFDNVNKMFEQFGNRTISASEGVDWKALSHAVRVLFEVEEILLHKTITFPLKEKNFVKSVKEGKVDVEEVMEFVNKKMDEVRTLLENTDLPEKSDRSLMDKIELNLYE